MNINQMHHEFELEANKIASLANMNFIPVEKDAYINKGIWFFLKDRYGIDLNTGKGFETNQDRISQLSNLHIKSPELQTPLNPTLISNGIYKVELKDLDFEYLFLTKATADIKKATCFKYNVRIKLKQTDDTNTIFSNPDFKWNIVNAQFGKTNSGTTINNEKSALYVYTEPGTTVENVYIDYIKYPNRVFFGGYNHIDGQSTSTDPKINCDIDSAFHDEIIRIAVDFAREDVGDIQTSQLRKHTINSDKQ